MRQVSLDELDEHQRDRHCRALEAIRDRREHGNPLILYLRKYKLHVFHFAGEAFGKEDIDATFLENLVYNEMPSCCRLVCVQDTRDGLFGNSTKVGRQAPGLFLKDDEWEQAVAELISVADLIVSEFQLFSEAIERELSLISHYQKRNRTLIVLPGQEHPFAWLGMHPAIQEFWRVAHYHELPQYGLLSSFFFRGLVEHCEAVWQARSMKSEQEPILDYQDFAGRLHLFGRKYFETEEFDYALMHTLRSARLLMACGNNGQAATAMMDCTAIMIIRGECGSATRFLAEAERLAVTVGDPNLLGSLTDLRQYYTEMCEEEQNQALFRMVGLDSFLLSDARRRWPGATVSVLVTRHKVWPRIAT